MPGKRKEIQIGVFGHSGLEAVERTFRGVVRASLNVSRRWLELEFRKRFDRSALQEVNRVRLDRARGLLELTELPIQQIADRVSPIDSRKRRRLGRCRNRGRRVRGRSALRWHRPFIDRGTGERRLPARGMSFRPRPTCRRRRAWHPLLHEAGRAFSAAGRSVPSG